MRLEAFPRPADDNGRGIHWSPSPYPPTGAALDFWLEELHALGIRWVKVVDDGYGSSLTLCQRLIQEGFMPLVRLKRHHPHPRRLTEEEQATIRQLVKVGVHYFETDHRPDLSLAWGEAMPPNWFDEVMDAFIADADVVLSAGGLPGIPAMTLHPDRNPVTAILRKDRGDLFERGVWWAVHAYTLNRPLNYPDDEVNRTGKPVTPEEYATHHPWGWNEPVELINQWRAEGMQPESTVADDPNCFRVYELAGAWAQQALGFPIPVIATEGGAVTGWRDDRRYPRLDPWTAAAWTEEIIRFLQEEAPPWFFTVCHWLLADRRMDASRPHAWESHCWYTHYWDKQFGFNGELPVVARVKALPVKVRKETHPTREEETQPLGESAATEEEDTMARPGALVGTVHDEEGRPLSAVKVRVYMPDRSYLIAEAHTDEEGNFRLTDLPPGEYELHVGDRGQVATVDLVPGETTEIEVVLHPLPEPETSPQQEAKVEPPREEPVIASPPPEEPEKIEMSKEDEALVRPAMEEPSPPQEPKPPTEAPPATETEERQDLAAAEEERRPLETEPPPPETKPTEPIPVPEAAREKGGRIVGEVPGGRPGVTVIAVRSSGERWETQLGEKGHFTLDNLPPGEYRLELEGVGVMAERLVLAPGSSEEVHFPMQGVIQGMVLGGTTETLVELISETHGWTRTVALSPQGQYRFIELPPGTYRVRVNDHYLPPITITGSEMKILEPVDLRPPHRAAVQGRVRDAHGDVLPDVVVQLLQKGQIVAETRTALNGSYAFQEMPPGEYQVVVRTEPEVVRTVFLEQDRTLEVNITLPVAVVDVTEPPAEEETPEPVSTEHVQETPISEEQREAPQRPTPEAVAEPVRSSEEGHEPVAQPQPDPQPEPTEDMRVTPKPLDTYILFPPPDHPMARAIVLAALPFIRRTGVIAGFHLEEAQHARRVLIVGDERIYGLGVEETLELAGCEVDRVPADPTTLVPMFRSLSSEEGR